MKITFRFFYILPFFVLIIIPAILVALDPFPSLTLGLWRWFGIALVIFGGAVFIAAHRAIYRPNQWAGVSSALPGEPNQLVTSGPYRFVRHPIVSAIILVLIGETLLSQSIMPFLWLMFLAITGIPFTIYFEEPRLEKKFGEAYRQYKKETPQFIPKLF